MRCERVILQLFPDTGCAVYDLYSQMFTHICGMFGRMGGENGRGQLFMNWPLGVLNFLEPCC